MTSLRLLTIPEVAAVLGCKERKVQGLIASGELPSLTCGRHRRVRSEALTAYCAALEQADIDERAKISRLVRRASAAAR